MYFSNLATTAAITFLYYTRAIVAAVRQEEQGPYSRRLHAYDTQNMAYFCQETTDYALPTNYFPFVEEFREQFPFTSRVTDHLYRVGSNPMIVKSFKFNNHATLTGFLNFIKETEHADALCDLKDRNIFEQNEETTRQHIQYRMEL